MPARLLLAWWLIGLAACAQQAQNPAPMVEHTRPHPRLKEQAPPGRREKLDIGTLFIPAGLRTAKRPPILFFFHGGTWLDTLLRTWYQLKFPIVCLVDGGYPGPASEGQAKRSLEIMNIRESAPKGSPEQIHRALEAALHEELAPSLNEVARRLGYGTTTRVRSTDRDLCAQIVLKHRKSGRSHWWMRRWAKPICELSQIRQVLEEHLASDGPIPPLDRIATSLGYAVDGSLRQKCSELCGALSARIAEQKRVGCAWRRSSQPWRGHSKKHRCRASCKWRSGSASLRNVVLKAHAPAIYEKFKARWRVYADTCQAELGTKLAAVLELEENPPPSLSDYKP